MKGQQTASAEVEVTVDSGATRTILRAVLTRGVRALRTFGQAVSVEQCRALLQSDIYFFTYIIFAY